MLIQLEYTFINLNCLVKLSHSQKATIEVVLLDLEMQPNV